MARSPRLSLASLTELCRVLRHYLGAGLMLRDVFQQQATRGRSDVRPLASRVAAVLSEGGTLEEALKRETAVLPPLLVSLAAVGEHTGMMPEVFGELERYFRRQEKLRRDFLARCTWPVLQFGLAVLVLTALILILGMLPSSKGLNGKPYDPLGLGLSGPTGALIFLGAVTGILSGLAALYLLTTRALGRGAAVAGMLLRLPALGPCLEALALARFCLALRLTTDTGMSINRALRLSLRATGNDAFIAAAGRVEASVRAGNDLTLSLASTGLFPYEFQQILTVAEESGRLPEVLHHQAEHYHDEAGRRLTVLTRVAAAGVWIVVAGLVILAIFRIFSTYLDALNAV